MLQHRESDSVVTSQVTTTGGMFQEASSFVQDLCGGCVERISAKPNNFDTDSGFEGIYPGNYNGESVHLIDRFRHLPCWFCFLPVISIAATATPAIGFELQLNIDSCIAFVGGVVVEAFFEAFVEKLDTRPIRHASQKKRVAKSMVRIAADFWWKDGHQEWL